MLHGGPTHDSEANKPDTVRCQGMSYSSIAHRTCGILSTTVFVLIRRRHDVAREYLEPRFGLAFDRMKSDRRVESAKVTAAGGESPLPAAVTVALGPQPPPSPHSLSLVVDLSLRTSRTKHPSEIM